MGIVGIVEPCPLRQTALCQALRAIGCEAIAPLPPSPAALLQINGGEIQTLLLAFRLPGGNRPGLYAALRKMGKKPRASCLRRPLARPTGDWRDTWTSRCWPTTRPPGKSSEGDTGPRRRDRIEIDSQRKGRIAGRFAPSTGPIPRWLQPIRATGPCPPTIGTDRSLIDGDHENNTMG